jgi:hypothetical protein
MEDKTIIMTFTNEALSLPGSLLEILVDVKVSFRTKGNKGNQDDVVAINTKVDKVLSIGKKKIWGETSNLAYGTGSVGSIFSCHGREIKMLV